MIDKKEKNVVTLDGETVSTEAAFSLNYGRLSAAMKAARSPDIEEKIAAMREALREKGPDAYCVSSIETPKAKQLSNLIAQIQIPKRKDKDGNEMEPPPAWIPYDKALSNWVQFKEGKGGKEKKGESSSEPEDPVACVKARAMEEVRKRAETAAAFTQFIPEDIKARRKRRTEERKARREEEEKFEALIEPFVNGQARVDNNKRPLYLKVNGMEVMTTHYDDFLSEGVACLENVRCKCAFCKVEHALGDTVEWEDGGNTVKKLAMRQIALVARTEDGKNDYIYRAGPSEGKPKKMYVVVCRRCGSIATRLSPKEKGRDGKTKPSVLPKDLYPALLKHIVGKKGGSSVLEDMLKAAPEKGAEAIVTAAEVREARFKERKGKTPEEFVAETKERHAIKGTVERVKQMMPGTKSDGQSGTAMGKFEARQAKTARLHSKEVAGKLGMKSE